MACGRGCQAYAEAVEYRIKAHTLSGMDATRLAALRTAYATTGWQGFWRKELSHLQVDPKHLPGPYILAQIHLRLGDRERALRYLQQAFQERHLLSALKVDAIFNPLHTDPRFIELLRQVGLAR